tara:strand:+ start:956 stop:1183 length:228 start_codon:yes stop_codon:yes gene_type:complete
MNDKDIEAQLGLTSRSVADLIEEHQDILSEDDNICEVINVSRNTLEFFLALGDESRALYEARNCRKSILTFLGLV